VNSAENIGLRLPLKTVTEQIQQYGSSTVSQQVNVRGRYTDHLLIQQLYIISATVRKETQ